VSYCCILTRRGLCRYLSNMISNKDAHEITVDSGVLLNKSSCKIRWLRESDIGLGIEMLSSLDDTFEVCISSITFELVN
jgi:hypothetical protein